MLGVDMYALEAVNLKPLEDPNRILFYLFDNKKYLGGLYGLSSSLPSSCNTILNDEQ